MDGILIASIGSVERSWTNGLKCAASTRTRTEDHARRRAVETSPNFARSRQQRELTVIEDLEIADNEGLTILPGVLELARRASRESMDCRHQRNRKADTDSIGCGAFLFLKNW